MLTYLVIGSYFAALFGAGYLGLRLARSAEDFVVAGRRLGPFMYVSAMSTVVLGGASTVGGVSLGYQYGLSGVALVAMLALGITAIGIFFSTRLSRLGVYTVAETLGLRYGKPARRISALIVVFYTLMVGVGQVVAIGTIFHVVIGLSTTQSILLGWAVTMTYCVAGGMWSITLTDVLQFCVMTVGVFAVLLPLAVNAAGGFGGMMQTLPDSYFSPTGIGISTILAYFLLFFFGFMIDQGNWQRVCTARSEKVAFWGCITSGGYCMAYGLVAAVIGAAAKAVLPTLNNPDNAFAAIAQEVLPIGLLGLVLAAGLAAAMSTASGLLIGSSTVLVSDLYREIAPARAQTVGANRAALAAVGVVALAISLSVGSVVGAVTVAADLLAAALFIPVLGALFWRRATATGALVSIGASSVVCVSVMAVAGLYANQPVIYGMLTSAVMFITVSLLSSHSAKHRATLPLGATDDAIGVSTTGPARTASGNG